MVKKDKEIKLTRKQEIFIAEYLKGKPGVQAALEAYDTTDYNTANQIAINNLQKDTIRRKIEGLAPGAIERVVKLSQTAKNEAVRLAANKDILDRGGFKPTDKIEQTFDGKVEIIRSIPTKSKEVLESK